jgi:hypothetical protein
MRSNFLARGSRLAVAAIALVMLATSAHATPSEAKDRDILAGLHSAFQLAVKRNDAATMRRILDHRFVLILGDGRRYSRADLLASAANRRVTYEKQDPEPDTRSVRLLGDMAVITARVWLKGTRDGVAFDRRIWFSDMYIRTPDGWRLAFCQASQLLFE